MPAYTVEMPTPAYIVHMRTPTDAVQIRPLLYMVQMQVCTSAYMIQTCCFTDRHIDLHGLTTITWFCTMVHIGAYKEHMKSLSILWQFTVNRGLNISSCYRAVDVGVRWEVFAMVVKL